MSSSNGELVGQNVPRQARTILVMLAWCVTIVATAAILDTRVSSWVNSTIAISRLMPLFKVMKSPGHFAFTIVVAIIVSWRHIARWRAGLFILVSGIVSGLLCALVKWGVGRTRPLHGVPPFEPHPFARGLAGLFSGENLSFPSGHTCLAFASATAVSLLFPRWRVVAYAVALVVAIERVLQNSHYVADVIAAAGLGILSAEIVRRFFSLPDQLIRRGGSCASC